MRVKSNQLFADDYQATLQSCRLKALTGFTEVMGWGLVSKLAQSGYPIVFRTAGLV